MANWHFSSYALLVLLAALLSTWLTVIVWRRRAARGARTLFFLILAAAFWCYAYAVEVAAVPLETNFLWNRIKYIAIAAIPVTWLIFAFEYAGLDRWVRRRNVALLFVAPLVTQGILWTNGWHHLFWRELGLNPAGRFPSMEFVYGTWFWIHTGFSYICFMTGAIILVLVVKRTGTIYRRQAATMLAGALAPFVSNAITIFNLSPIPELDLTPLAFTVTSLLFAWGLLRFRLLDLVPELESADRFADSRALVSALASLRRRILELLLTGTLVVGTVSIVLAWIDELSEPQFNPRSIGLFLIAYLTIVALKLLRSLPYAVRAGGLLVAQYLLALRFVLLNGLEVDAGVILFALVNFALVLFNMRVALATLALSLATLGLGGWFILSGFGQATPRYGLGAGGLDAVAVALVLSAFAGILLGAQIFINGELRRFIQQAQDLSNDLDLERRRLEERVVERSRLLQASHAASRQLAAITDFGRLVQDVVNIVQEAFDYYHVHIYLLDETGNELVMVAGTGDAGRSMLERGHRLRRTQGMVGLAASRRRTFFAPDVTRQASWLANPLLPETQSEAAVPILLGDLMLGVLDVQENRLDGITPEAITLLESIAGQMAVALQNARRLAEAEEMAEHEARLMNIIRSIQKTSSIDQALQVAVSELGSALQAGPVRVRLSAAADGEAA